MVAISLFTDVYWLNYTTSLHSCCKELSSGFSIFSVCTRFHYYTLPTTDLISGGVCHALSFSQRLFPFCFVPMARIVCVFILEVQSQGDQRGGEKKEALFTVIGQNYELVKLNLREENRSLYCISRGSL